MLADGERPRGGDRLGAASGVDRVQVGEQTVAAAPTDRAVDGGVEGQVQAVLLDAVPGDERLLADVEGPQHEARVLPTDDLLVGVEGPDLEAASVGATERGHEREEIEAPLDARPDHPELRREEDRLYALVAEQVVHIHVEREDRETDAAGRARPVEDEGEEGGAAHLFARRRRRRPGRARGRRAAVGEEEQPEALVVVAPAGGGEGVEDVGAIVAHGAAPLAEREERADVEDALRARAAELEQGTERRPVDPVGVAGVAGERPELHVERRRRACEQEPEHGENATPTARSQRPSGHAPGSGRPRRASARRRWWSCVR